VTLLLTISVLEFILLDIFITYFCLSYEKLNYCKIQNSIIKTAVLFDKKYLLACIYVSKILFLLLI